MRRSATGDSQACGGRKGKGVISYLVGVWYLIGGCHTSLCRCCDEVLTYVACASGGLDRMIAFHIAVGGYGQLLAGGRD